MDKQLHISGYTHWRLSARWFALAVGVLTLSGMLAIALVVGRVPPFDGWLGQVLDAGFFRRCLVVHVDLALVVWFHAFAAALIALVARARRLRMVGTGLAVAQAGVLSMVASAFFEGAEPILANYVPVLDHPLFLGGLGLFGAGLVMVCLAVDPRRRAPGLPESVAVAARFAAGALLIAAATFATSVIGTPAGLPAESYYELLVWGGGHVLQVASYITLIAAWLWMLEKPLGRSFMSPRQTAAALGALLAPWIIAPALPLFGTATTVSRVGFTRLMQWAIFPVVCVVLYAAGRALWARRRELEASPAVVAFACAAGLALTGFVLGALITTSNTVIPGHYHAAIGAVTVTCMGLSYGLLERYGRPLATARRRWLAARQPALFGVGQFVFAVGFAMAGMPRKTYGAEQHARDLIETLGLWVMGVGGLGAVAGGLLFLGLVGTAWFSRGAETAPVPEATWRAT